MRFGNQECSMGSHIYIYISWALAACLSPSRNRRSRTPSSAWRIETQHQCVVALACTSEECKLCSLPTILLPPCCKHKPQGWSQSCSTRYAGRVQWWSLVQGSFWICEPTPLADTTLTYKHLQEWHPLKGSNQGMHVLGKHARLLVLTWMAGLRQDMAMRVKALSGGAWTYRHLVGSFCL